MPGPGKSLYNRDLLRFVRAVGLDVYEIESNLRLLLVESGL